MLCIPDASRSSPCGRMYRPTGNARSHMKEFELTQFTELGLHGALLKSLKAEGYSAPTPIQAQAIPKIMAGSDLLGIAQTGTGKTAAFALPILHRLLGGNGQAKKRCVRALILSPTRELASQIGASFKTYGRDTGLSVAVIFGGVGPRSQISTLKRGVDILVATPGRLLDHLDQGNVTLSGTEILVLDEADQMLDMGFVRPIRKILSTLPRKRQSLFFSATMPGEIARLSSEMLNNPERVSVAPASRTADRVAQSVIHIETAKKNALLVELFGNDAMHRVIVFTRTKHGADKVGRCLNKAGIKIGVIHGNKSQGQRRAALDAFKAGKIRGLVATDVAARGIDIDQVSHVINYNLPHVPESYVHRIGRTARAGAEGIAISLCDGEERALLRGIERLIRQTIPSEDRRGDGDLLAAAAVGGTDMKRTHNNGSGKKRRRPHRGKPGKPQSQSGQSQGAKRRDSTRDGDIQSGNTQNGGAANAIAPRGEKPNRGKPRSEKPSRIRRRQRRAAAAAAAV